MRYSILSLLLCLCTLSSFAQTVVTGKVYDSITKEGLISAAVVIEGTTVGVTTDFDGNFRLETERPLPFSLQVTYISYKTNTIAVTAANAGNVVFIMKNDAVLMDAVEIKAQRISQKQQQAALTVETMDVLAIKEAASGSFYESLGTMKEVDVTSASLGFKVINTRGFNSTSPVRSLQLIDGVDNQSPGLNFSLGNFLGASDLDVKSVEIIAGASSAFFGPGAFNGVVNMTTKDPFIFPGVSLEVKAGERALVQTSVRVADAIKNKEGEKRFGYEFNIFNMQANDWEATDYSPIEGSEYGADHPFGFDAVNIYGDEPVSLNNSNLGNLLPQEFSGRPGVSVIYRNGYRERDLLSYNTTNSKVGGNLHQKLNDKVIASYGFNYSTGNTIYQGDNRYALKGVQFFQHKVEVGEKDKWFLRAYRTSEDAGQTYDVVTTAIRMQEAQGNTSTWNNRYFSRWSNTILGQNPQIDSTATAIFDGIVPQIGPDGLSQEEALALYESEMLQYIADNAELFGDLHEQNTAAVNAQGGAQLEPFYQPGTARFDSLFNDITSRTFTEGGSRFYDRSALNHVQGEYKWDINRLEMTMGANARWYRPDSRGTIFSDTLDYTYQRDSLGNIVLDGGRAVALDSNRVQIKNQEWGAYLGARYQMYDETLTASATARVDKNQNFDYLISPALSLVYAPSESSTFRMSLSSAIRNPTLADQYLYYNVGRAILLGNVDGRYEAGKDSLFTVESFNNFRQDLDSDTLEYFNVDAIRPEKVRTFELGYRGKVTESFYIDVSGYYSRYTDFIGFKIGLDSDPVVDNLAPTGLQAYRIAANAESIVTTQGASLGFNYYFKKLSINGNYSYNELVSGEDDPIIPAFNTPKHKFNLGFSAREVLLFKKIPHFGYGLNYKWIEGFTFEGSPQFTGSIPTYDMVDAQMNLYVPSLKSTFKVGGSNILGLRPLFASGVENRWDAARNNNNLQVYGGPRVGRLLYFSWTVELK